MQGAIADSFDVFDRGGAEGASRLVREIRRARRHAQVVRALKLVLPLACVALTLLLVLPSAGSRRGGGSDLKLDSARISDEGISMDNPRISGIGSKGRPFEIQARRAIQNIRNPKIVTFEDLQAKIRVSETDTATVASRQGIYDSEHDSLKLAGDIRVRSNTGYEADLLSADVDLKHGNMHTDEPAVIRTASGVIHGQTLTIVENGNVISLDGGVRMTLVPTQGPHP